ncbi:arginine decarboxylase [Pseudomonas syringae pv. actinidiae]|nr:arginine decarboxylase [Pseudomonas syringae pv. actinidiae]
MSVRRTRKDDGSQWTVADSRSVYGIRHWGAGYFAINEAGRVEVRPNGPESSPIDLYEQVDNLRKSGLSLPLLVRFPDILQDRVRQLTGAFDSNIARLEYQSQYTALYPIKVNQQEAVVENIIATQNVSIGLEAGSKPELMAVLALAPKGGTIVCNGYKDREFIRLALMGQKLGHNVFIVIEKESEVELVIEEAAELKVAPQVGLRVRLSSLASSKWADTGGEKSKFGLSAAQLLSVVERFRKAGLDQASACCTSTWARRSPTWRTTSTASRKRSATTANCANSACRWITSMSVAVWASITTVLTRAMPARSTTTWTITPVSWSACSRNSATRRACRIRTFSRKAAAR